MKRFLTVSMGLGANTTVCEVVERKSVVVCARLRCICDMRERNKRLHTNQRVRSVAPADFCFLERRNRNILSGIHGLFRKLLEVVVLSQRMQGPRRVFPTSRLNHIRASPNP